MSGVHVEVEPSVLSTTAGHLRQAVAVAEDFTSQHGAPAALVDDADALVDPDGYAENLIGWARAWSTAPPTGWSSPRR